VEKLDVIADALAAIYADMGTLSFFNTYKENMDKVVSHRSTLFRYPELESIFRVFTNEIHENHRLVRNVWERLDKGELSKEQVEGERAVARAKIEGYVREFAQKVDVVVGRRPLP
jgi:hypothetical protein